MPDEEIQLVVFALKSGNSTCEYGVPITQVQEINRLTNPTKLPKVPSFVEGVINLRGKVIPVIDLKKRFDLEIGEYTDDTRIIVVEIDGHTVGIIVDEVTEVLRLATSQIEPPPSIIGGIAADYLKGVGKIGERLLVLLDLHKILTESEKKDLANVEVT
ncbi:MAG: chemotaxis protein CheW [Firmicutes bacterium]|nr:chemotaxis protein CheW [Bacillota bacterium]